MEARPVVSKEHHKSQRRTPAWHFVRPLMLVGAALLLYGVSTNHLLLTLSGIFIEGLAALLAIVLYISCSRRREQQNQVVCG
jgi:hypothetical protein